MTRTTIDTTYADLRPDDLVIDKSGQAWPIAELATVGDQVSTFGVTFWLLDPVSKIKAHLITKQNGDAVKVSRVPTQADEAAKLEAEFPSPSVEVYVEAQRQIKSIGASDEDADEAAVFVAKYLQDETVIFPDSFPTIAAVDEIGGTVEAEVTAAEVDAATAATDDSPLTLPAFDTMTPLEQRRRPAVPPRPARSRLMFRVYMDVIVLLAIIVGSGVVGFVIGKRHG
jgi:hypothetical protein